MLRNGSHAMDTKEQMMTRRIGSWRFQQMQVTSLSSILLETTLIWKFHKVDDFYYHTQKGRHPWFSNLKFSIKKKKHVTFFFSQIHMKTSLQRKLKPRRKGLPRMNISDSETLHETRRLLVSLLEFCVNILMHKLGALLPATHNYCSYNLGTCWRFVTQKCNTKISQASLTLALDSLLYIAFKKFIFSPFNAQFFSSIYFNAEVYTGNSTVWLNLCGINYLSKKCLSILLVTCQQYYFFFVLIKQQILLLWNVKYHHVNRHS